VPLFFFNAYYYPICNPGGLSLIKNAHLLFVVMPLFFHHKCICVCVFVCTFTWFFYVLFWKLNAILFALFYYSFLLQLSSLHKKIYPNGLPAAR